MVLGSMSFVPVVEVEANSGSGLFSAHFEGPGSSGALDAVPITDATAEKVNKWNKNTLVWFPRTRRTLILDELLPSALSAPSAATELLPQSAAIVGYLPRFQFLLLRPSYCRSLPRLLRCSPLCSYRARWRSPPCVARALDFV